MRSVDDRPSSIPLTASNAGGFFGTPIDPYRLAEVCTFVTARSAVEIAYVEIASTASARVVPRIAAIRPSAVQTIIVSPISVALILAIQTSRQEGACRTAEHDAGDGRAAIAATKGISKKPPDQCAGNYARGVDRIAAVIVVDVVAIRIMPIVRIATRRDRRSAIVRISTRIISPLRSTAGRDSKRQNDGEHVFHRGNFP
jgi:hypothetical protein